jgi:hypothetical protein
MRRQEGFAYNQPLVRKYLLQESLDLKSRWEMHNNVRIFHFDLSGYGMDDEGIIKETDEADAVLMAEPKNSVRILNDVRQSVGSMKVLQHLQLSADRSSPYISRAAVVGVTGGKLIMLQLVNRFSSSPIVAFDTIEQAKDWLVMRPVGE